MRRIGGSLLLVLGLVACEGQSSPWEVQTPESVPIAGPSMEIRDGSQLEGNQHFFWLSPLVQNPSYGGTADDSLEPTLTVCPLDLWSEPDESCSDPLVTYTTDSGATEERIVVDPGVKYHVIWRTQDHPAIEGTVYRISASVLGRVLGFIDVKAYDNSTYNSYQHTDPDGFVAISDNGSLNIAFRIEVGALEEAFCDDSGLEDCDVGIFRYETGGSVEVFENPGAVDEILASKLEIPAFSAQENGSPVAGSYAVILELEDEGVFQSGSIPQSQQVPYFIDVRTEPPGITFDLDGPGVRVALCQDDDSFSSVPEYLHPYLVIFKVHGEGTPAETTELLPTSFGAPECDPEAHSADASDPRAGHPRGILDRLASVASRASRLLLPEPLHAAWFLHGGLNTVMRDFSELGAVLNVDPPTSTATVPNGQVGEPTSIVVEALNALGDPFPFQVEVEVTVAGANTAAATVTYDGGGFYTAQYTPTSPGDDQVSITINGAPIAGSPFTSAVLPLAASGSGSTFTVSYSEAGSPTTVTVQVNDSEGNPYVYGESWPVTVAVDVTGANTASLTAEDDDGAGNYDGVYVATYTPADYGTDQISVTVNGSPVPGSPFSSTVAPRPADPSQSSASVGAGLVGSPTTVLVDVRNTAGDAYTYGDIRPIMVEVSVTGANTATAAATDGNQDGIYEATYTPGVDGADFIAVTIDGTPIAGSPFTSQVAPLVGDLQVVVSIAGGAPEDGLPIYLYEGSTLVDSAFTDAGGQVTFPDRDFGAYTVFLARHDFDMSFDQVSVPVQHNTDPTVATFSGTTLPLPAATYVHRIRDGGNGNAFKYMVGTRSWTSAMNQVDGDVLHDVTAHLATITDAGENTFVAGVVAELCPNVTNEKRCKYQGWIGLSDEALEGTFAWVTGEAVTFFSWGDGEPSDGQRGNEDHVEINLFGKWNDINGASSTNEGYVAEWEVIQPIPPF